MRQAVGSNAMKANIYSNKTKIGTTELSVTDNSMGCLSGEFIPNISYNQIKDKVLKFNSMEKKDFKLWENLRLNVQLENGYFIYPIGGISIYDFYELKDENIEIDVSGVYRHVIEEYFENDQIESFIEEPWESISIDQKIAFEEELKKEIGYEKDIFRNLLDFKKPHTLNEYTFSALCTSGINDDVLFAIHKNSGSEYSFVLVHLTWSQKREKTINFPLTEYFSDFDKFRQKMMMPDNIEWKK